MAFMERKRTIRQQIKDLLLESECSIRELSQVVGISEKEVIPHLEQIKISFKKQKRFQIIPAICRQCGFVFEGRQKIKKPSKCPECRRNYIESPRYKIEEEK